MIDLDIKIDQKQLLRALEKSPDKTQKAVWRATGRSLGAFRREFLSAAKSRVQFRGTPQGRGKGGKQKNLAAGFTWKRNPTSVGSVKAGTKVGGVFFTESKAALGLELGTNFGAARKRFLAIPIGFALNKAGNPKPGWNSPALARKRFGSAFKFFTVHTGGRILLMVKKAKTKGGKAVRRSKPKPAFLLVRSVKPRPRLKLYSEWTRFQKEVVRRFDEEIAKVVSKKKGGR